MSKIVCKRGDLLFTRGNTLLSWTLRKFQDFDYSHVCWCVSDSFIIEADWSGVISTPVSSYEDSKWETKVVSTRLSSDMTEKISSDISAQLGKKYDYLQDFGLLLSKILHRPRKLPAIFDNPNHFFCAELIAKQMVKNGVDFDGIDPSQIYPKDLYFYFCRNQ